MRPSLCFVSILVVCGGSSLGRDIKPLRSLPSITNSLVNLGKMEISFHISSPYRPNHGLTSKSEFVHSGSAFNIPKVEPQLESCPCSSFNNLKTPLQSNSADMINKILRSNDLFEPVESSACCDSHENEDNIFLELIPKNYDGLSPSFHPANTLMQPGVMPLYTLLSESLQPKPRGLNSESSLIQPGVMSSLPLLLESFHPQLPLATQYGNKPGKAIEIFFFPKNKASPTSKPTVSSLDKKTVKTPQAKMSAPQKKVSKSEIKVVGDKELKTGFKNSNVVGLSFPKTQINMSLSKNEKARQEKKERKALNEMKAMEKELEMKEKELETQPKIKIIDEKYEDESFAPVATSDPPDVL